MAPSGLLFLDVAPCELQLADASHYEGHIHSNHDHLALLSEVPGKFPPDQVQEADDGF